MPDLFGGWGHRIYAGTAAGVVSVTQINAKLPDAVNPTSRYNLPPEPARSAGHDMDRMKSRAYQNRAARAAL